MLSDTLRIRKTSIHSRILENTLLDFLPYQKNNVIMFMATKNLPCKRTLLSNAFWMHRACFLELNKNLK